MKFIQSLFALAAVLTLASLTSCASVSKACSSCCSAGAAKKECCVKAGGECKACAAAKVADKKS